MRSRLAAWQCAAAAAARAPSSAGRYRLVDLLASELSQGAAAADVGYTAWRKQMSRNLGTESGLNAAQTQMRYKNLGDSGLLVSELSFGCMMFQEESADGYQQAYKMMQCAYSHGVNFFDNAEICATSIRTSVGGCLAQTAA